MEEECFNSKENIKLYKLRKKERLRKEKRSIKAKCREDILSRRETNFTKSITRTLQKQSVYAVGFMILSITFSNFLGLSDQAIIVLGTSISLIITAVTIVIWRYYIKSYSETKAEEDIKLERDKLGLGKVVENVVGAVVGEDDPGK